MCTAVTLGQVAFGVAMGMATAAARKPPSTNAHCPITQDSTIFYEDHALFDDYTGTVMDTEEGKRLAHALGGNKAAILRNHGILTVGRTPGEAFMLLYYFERAARIQLMMQASGQPIIGAGAGTGISAKCEEAAGVDMIIIYNSGRFRMAGRGSMAGNMPYGNANDIVKEMGPEILTVVKHTPVLAGVCGTSRLSVTSRIADWSGSSDSAPGCRRTAPGSAAWPAGRPAAPCARG